MRVHRVNILGASGCGASTTGRALAATLGLPHFDSDDYFHEPTDPPFQKPRDPLVRRNLLIADFSRSPGWVLSGGIVGWNPYPQVEFTLVVFLWIPTDTRMQRLRQREQQRFGPRILPGGDMHADHEEFIAWASRYDYSDVPGKTLALEEAWLGTQTCPVVQVRRPATTDEIVEHILSVLD